MNSIPSKLPSDLPPDLPPELATLWSQEGWHTYLGWIPTPTQVSQLRALYSLILEGNQRQNLTRIVGASDFWEKHLWDSLRGIQTLALSEDSLSVFPPLARQRILDLGTGAGFPGIPIAIACPECAVTLMDSTQRKIQFVQTVVEALDLANATTLSERIEVLAHQSGQRASYELAVSRALAPAVACVEYSLPFLSLGGQALLYRGQWTQAETQSVTQAAQYLGGSLTQIDAFHTPLTRSIRHCVVLTKTHPTPPAYPRATGVPTRQLLA